MFIVSRQVVTFQSTLPRRERRITTFFRSRFSPNFNPRSREGSDVLWKATLISSGNFNPRSREGSDAGREIFYRHSNAHFNPRSREGSDFNHIIWCHQFSCISIHAPAKGATPGFLIPLAVIQISIHAPAKGATRSSAILISFFTDFNPRSREGSDVVVSNWLSYQKDFNPRSREGSDQHCIHLIPYLINISIHAPAKGATIVKVEFVHDHTISIHAPAKGATSRPPTMRTRL